MAVQVFKNAFVKIGTSGAPSTNYWPYVRSVTMNFRQEVLDRTAMGSSGRKRTFGLKDGSLTIEFNQEYSTSVGKSVDKLLNGLIGIGSSAVYISVRATTSLKALQNSAAYRGRYVLESYNPMSGNVADLGVVTANFVADGAITRTTSTAA